MSIATGLWVLAAVSTVSAVIAWVGIAFPDPFDITTDDDSLSEEI